VSIKERLEDWEVPRVSRNFNFVQNEYEKR
jgi:hypothetical protein